MKKLSIIIIILISLFLIGCSVNYDTNIQQNTGIKNDLEDAPWKKLESSAQLKELLAKDIQNQVSTLDYAMVERSFSESSATQDSSGGKASDGKFTQTNVQETGVDESDIVKTDGSHIYTISGKTLNIVDTQNNEVIYSKKYEDERTIENIFISNNTLVVLGHKNTQITKVSSQNLEPYTSYETQTVVEFYNIEDKKNPNKINQYEVTGNFYDARLINNYLYFISTKSTGSDHEFPILYKEGTRIAQPDVFYFDIYPSSQYYTISSVDITNTNSYDSESYLLERGSTLYVSQNSIYIAYPKQIKTNVTNKFKKVVFPELDSSQRDIFEKHIEREDYEAIAITLEEYINNLNKEEEKQLLENIQKNIQDFYDKQQAEERKTLIHKFPIENGTIYYTGQQEVDGHLLNQFSLDEYNGMLRVATTTSYWIRGEGSHSYNNVFILDENLEYIGWIERLAEDERIYSARFMDETLYLVTYKEIDPLFAIDLSTPENPEVIGEVKLPGFSSYLHPYGEDRLIGVGMETRENSQGFVETLGLKVSLFDVSNKSNPQEVDNYIVEGRHTSSDVFSDHKAFTFLESEGILILPVQEQISDEVYRFENKAVVFEINYNEISKKGDITHDASKEYYYYNDPSVIKRSIIIDDFIYTISEKEIIVSDKKSVDKIDEIDLPYSEDERYYPIYR